MGNAPAEIILPGFGRYPKEGMIIGRLLAGYGELELEMCNCVAAVNKSLDDAVRALFGVRGEKKRIDTADTMMRAAYVAVGLGSKYLVAIEGMDWCREVRNQYSHCHWYDTKNEGLCFINLETAAASKNHLFPLQLHRLPVDEALFLNQEAYFKYIQKCFWYLEEVYRASQGNQRKGEPLFAWPAQVNVPARHN